eukprot:UN22697
MKSGESETELTEASSVVDEKTKMIAIINKKLNNLTPIPNNGGLSETTLGESEGYVFDRNWRLFRQSISVTSNADRGE